MCSMSPLWTSAEIAAATDGVANAHFECTGVAFDSREIGPGDLFLAMKGEQADGHRFVAQAFASGAVGAVVSAPVDGPHILVPDTMRALERLGISARQRVDALLPFGVRQVEISGNVRRFTDLGDRRGDAERPVAIDDEARIVGHEQRRVERSAEMLGERADADIPGDMAPALDLGQAEIAERARNAVGGVLAQQEIGRGPVRIDHGIGRRLVDGEQRRGGIVPKAVLRPGDDLGRRHDLSIAQ